MVAAEGKGTSSAINIAQKTSFHFMPTPMVARKVRADHVTPDPAVMMPIGDQDERGHSVTSNLPNVEETSTLRATKAQTRRIAKTTVVNFFGVNRGGAQYGPMWAQAHTELLGSKIWAQFFFFF